MINKGPDSRFQALNKHILNICDKLANNENIIKCLLDDSSDPLRADLDELLKKNGYKRPSDVINKHIFPYTFIPDAEEDNKVYIMIGIDDFRLNKYGASIKNGVVVADVLCHRNLMVTNSGLRTYIIMSEIDKELNNYRIGVAPLIFKEGIVWYRQPRQYIGYGLSYVITNAN